MNELVKQNSQFIISTHSPILMTYPDADLWELSRDGMRQVSYRETEHYQLTRNFLENPERMLGYLFGED
jgi:predicted ATPase